MNNHIISHWCLSIDHLSKKTLGMTKPLYFMLPPSHAPAVPIVLQCLTRPSHMMAPKKMALSKKLTLSLTWKFIIKDHWVQGQELEDVLKEVEILKQMQGIAGVPQLVDYWVVERGNQTQDQTSHLCFMDFQSTSKSKRELVTVLCDIISSILHNAMIKDLEGAIRGCLIDWEFAIHTPSTPLSDNERILTRGG
ncbi:hypothetical protein F4604DRAFT_1686068 [Suillus subluteus]|nr:hypothetical protein F4604DRAFT_1686068 [Suillus subluteus]